MDIWPQNKKTVDSIPTEVYPMFKVYFLPCIRHLSKSVTVVNIIDYYCSDICADTSLKQANKFKTYLKRFMSVYFCHDVNNRKFNKHGMLQQAGIAMFIIHALCKH